MYSVNGYAYFNIVIKSTFICYCCVKRTIKIHINVVLNEYNRMYSKQEIHTHATNPGTQWHVLFAAIASHTYTPCCSFRIEIFNFK